MPYWLKAAHGQLLLTLHVQPGTKPTAVAGTHGDALKIRLAAPRIDGRAKEALPSYIAAQFGVPSR